MKQKMRQAALLDIITKQGMLPVRTLARRLSVSEMTVRRDLEALDMGNPTDRGATGSGRSEYNLLEAALLAHEQKDRIGTFAASLLEDDDLIIIDTGSTTAKILPHIPMDIKLTVLCFNANVMKALQYHRNIHLLFAGGQYHPNTEMFESAEGLNFIRRFRANKMFLSAAGIHESLGITCAYGYEAHTKQTAIASSLERILVADSSKFGQLRPHWFCSMSDVTSIVTDTHLSESWQQKIRVEGAQLHMV